MRGDASAFLFGPHCSPWKTDKIQRLSPEMALERGAGSVGLHFECEVFGSGQGNPAKKQKTGGEASCSTTGQ